MSIPDYGIAIGDHVSYRILSNGHVVENGYGYVLGWVDPWRIEIELALTDEEYWEAEFLDEDFEDTVVVPASQVKKVHRLSRRPRLDL